MVYYVLELLHVTPEDFFSENIIFIHFHKLDIYLPLKIGLMAMLIDILSKTFLH